ncbi:MAG: hypothetical protein E4H30_03890 [Methanomassiliicoccus sp.]|nr:MAG: hypothetical protein E4H30_03890 [Methanomassiliicoccus sp.]
MITEDFAAYAARVRVRFAAPTAPERIQEMLESFMSGVAMDCLEAGTRLIGHIKSVVESDDKLIACSVTDHDAKVRCRGHFETPQTNVDVIINVLQYGLAKKDLVRIVEGCSERNFTGASSIGIEDLEIEEKDLIRLG